MKKIISLILAAAVLLSGCSAGNNPFSDRDTEPEVIEIKQTEETEIDDIKMEDETEEIKSDELMEIITGVTEDRISETEEPIIIETEIRLNRNHLSLISQEELSDTVKELCKIVDVFNYMSYIDKEKNVKINHGDLVSLEKYGTRVEEKFLNNEEIEYFLEKYGRHSFIPISNLDDCYNAYFSRNAVNIIPTYRDTGNLVENGTLLLAPEAWGIEEVPSSVLIKQNLQNEKIELYFKLIYIENIDYDGYVYDDFHYYSERRKIIGTGKNDKLVLDYNSFSALKTIKYTFVLEDEFWKFYYIVEQ